MLRNNHKRNCDLTLRSSIEARFGFTVLELMIVIVIIAVLASLVGSAVMSARESARRMECSSHLRQVGIAVQEYHSSHGVLPCSGLLGFRYISTLLEGRPGNWNVYGAPDPCMLGPCPEVGDWIRPPVLLCPSDPLVHRTRRSESFCFSAGNRNFGANQGGVSDGIGFGDVDPTKVISFRDVTDGLTSTALVSEQLISLTSAAASDVEYLAAFDQSLAVQNPLRFIWNTSEGFNLPEDMLAVCTECDDGTAGAVPHFAGNPFNVRVPSYDHARPPNSRACSLSAKSILGPISPPTSLHRLGVNVGFCDGSVRFIPNSIDETVWHAIGTRSGNETKSDL
ncbi:MAG: DUF1559 domain-containing protein [Schlesneria sp.]